MNNNSLSPMKKAPILLTVLLACCMAAAPQNAAAQSSMRTSSPVPPQVELMYVKGLRYLQNAQKTDGTYDGTYGQEPGIIGFCLMSVLAHGDDPNTGPYATMVRRCVNYILSKQNRGSGYIGDSMYNHGFATLALAEAYGMVRDDRIGPALRKAVALTLTAQKKNKTGGWRYSPESTDADSTVTGCQIVSLFAARNAGIPVPDEAFERGLKYMASCRDKKGAYGYTGPAGPRVTLTAIGSLTLSLARLKTDPSFKDSLAYLKKNLNYRDSSYPFYFEYYMSQALFHADQEVWKEWNYKNMRYLGASQAPNGSWLSDHSAAYSTSAALLSLALNYRFYPSMNNRIRLSLLLAPVCLLTAWANSVVDVVTDSNYRLRGEIVSYGKQGIVIKHPAMRQNAVILPSEIRALYFTGTSSPDLQSQGQDFHGHGAPGYHPVQHHLHHAGQGAVPGHAGQRAFHPPRPGGRLPLDTLQERASGRNP